MSKNSWNPDVMSKKDFTNNYVPAYLATYAVTYPTHNPPIEKALREAEEAYKKWIDLDEEKYDRSW